MERLCDEYIKAMFSPPLTAAARILATLAILVSFVPCSSACCCVRSSWMAQAAGEADKCCLAETVKSCCGDEKTSCCCCKGKGVCNCGKSGRSVACQCESQEAGNQDGPYVPTSDAPVRSQHDVDLSVSVPVVVPTTAASFAFAFSLTPEAAFDHQPPSLQVLLQVWRN